jgi:hypothetical protein
MLLGQQRGRAQDRDLLAVGHGDEGGAHGDLGLAEADVAADQAIHRLAGFHVLDHGIDRGLLVGRLLEAEAIGEGFQVVLLEARTCGPSRAARWAYRCSSSAAVSCTCRAAFFFAFSHWPEPSVCSWHGFRDRRRCSAR